ncbi:hypothetical protein BDQ17DRAFT_1549485 [Cyathus striatus]|nr:hypothetical protein BDQ17DRAFT_1549485 [Cyathus striatus]
MTDIPNIIVFGETGAGKSSVINMLPGDSGEARAEVADHARGVTKEARMYLKTIRRKKFNVWDTPGLNEGNSGTVNSTRAVEILLDLVSSSCTGINMLVMVMRAPRITDFLPKAYRLLHSTICQKSVPIAIVVTGLDNNNERKEWWDNNRKEFNTEDMIPHGHACLTTLESCGDTYMESKIAIEKLIHENYTDKSWMMPTVASNSLISALEEMLGQKDAEKLTRRTIKRRKFI